MDIIENDWGVANTIDGKIYLNKNLTNFPELRKRIIRHELEHTKAKGFFAQRKIDALTELKFRNLFPFYKRYPKTFLQQHLPITYKDNTLYFEWTLIFIYTFYLALGGLIFWLINVFSKDSIFFWKVIQYMFGIFLIIIGLYFIGKKLKEYVNKEAKKEVTKK